MTELTFTILKYALLILLWVFVFCVIRSLGRDVQSYSPRSRDRRTSKTSVKNAPSATPDVQKGTVPPSSGGATPSMLVFIDGPLVGITRTLGSRPLTLGRAPDNTVMLDENTVSAHHARIFKDPASGSWAVEDLNSTNGTLVNGQKIHGAVMLPARVPVRIGTTTFELR